MVEEQDFFDVVGSDNKIIEDNDPMLIVSLTILEEKQNMTMIIFKEELQERTREYDVLMNTDYKTHDGLRIWIAGSYERVEKYLEGAVIAHTHGNDW